MLKKFCVANQKGGVGKTTTAVNMAAGLISFGKKVLLIDLDPQGNATMGSGISKMNQKITVYHLMLEDIDPNEALIHTTAGYDIIAANRELAAAELELVKVFGREYKLKDAVAKLKCKYDFILIDCPPSLSLLTINGLCVAQGVIIPMQCEYYALEGLTDIVNTIKHVSQNFNKALEDITLLRVMFDPRITLQQDVSAQIKSYFGEKVYETIIPRNVRLAEAPSFGLAGISYDASSRGAKAYLDFCKEFLGKFSFVTEKV